MRRFEFPQSSSSSISLRSERKYQRSGILGRPSSPQLRLTEKRHPPCVGAGCKRRLQPFASMAESRPQQLYDPNGVEDGGEDGDEDD